MPIMDPSLRRSLVKVQCVYSIESKMAVNVASALNTNLFPYFGFPRILHSDIGREFINQVQVFSRID